MSFIQKIIKSNQVGEKEVKDMQIQAQTQMNNHTCQVHQTCNNQKVIINEQDFEPLQLIIYATRLKMEGKEVVIESADGKQCAV